MLPSNWYGLNVGGTTFITKKSTFSSIPESNLLKLLTNAETPRDSDDYIIIDRNPETFPEILNFLRIGKFLPKPTTNLKRLLAETQFYGISTLEQQITALISKDTSDVASSSKLNKISYSVSQYDPKIPSLENALNADAKTGKILVSLSYDQKRGYFATFSSTS